MEEKNKIVELYIEDKIKELESMLMYVPNENKKKLLMAFMNRNEDIEIIKTRIDTIFNKADIIIPPPSPSSGSILLANLVQSISS